MNKETIKAAIRSKKAVTTATHAFATLGGAAVAAAASFWYFKQEMDKQDEHWIEVLNRELEAQEARLTAREKKGEYASIETLAASLGIDVNEVEEFRKSRETVEKVKKSKKGKKNKAESGVERQERRLREGDYHDYQQHYVPEEKIEGGDVNVRNVFVDGAELQQEDYDEDYVKPDSGPYLITKDEMLNGQNIERELTYYKEDDTLADEHDNVIEDADSLVGNENLQQFGRISGNPRIVFVRNDDLDVDFEINLSDGSYTREVHGFIEHEDSGLRGARRFRAYHDD